MVKTMEEYMSKTQANYGSGIVRPKIDDNDHFELKGQFLKELCNNTFSGSDHEDVKEHIKKVLDIVNLFYIPNITQDQVMLRVFPMSLTGAASRWLRNKPSGLIKTWEDLKVKFLSKYYPPARTAKKMKEINNFQQEPNEIIYQAWERFKELLMKCPQHYYINNVCFENALADLNANVSVMPLSTYLNLGLGKLTHTMLTVELANRTVKHPKRIAENVLVGIGKFIFPVDFIILDMPEDVKVPLILEDAFLLRPR
ncbi:hypothetical protein Tco_0829715 [Tanacetum coccineum]